MPTLRPWSEVQILECDEPLQELPATLWRIEPHPYRSLGAPYGRNASPFRLRRGVIVRLLEAQSLLQQRHPGSRLAIFDAWRPVAVQAFMVEHAITETCRERGLDPDVDDARRQAVVLEVGRFWAPPNLDPAFPPPHSTGGAVDLTLADGRGRPLAMGGAIDAIGSLSEPDHYAGAPPDSEAGRWHQRRRLLATAMDEAGFAQHPNEWWHFSHGDQLWAWRHGRQAAIYGRASEDAGGDSPAASGIC